MSEEKKYRKYTAADIEKYHKGLLSPKEMHEFEKAALDDPFLSDALEGYGSAAVNISKDLPELEKRLEERITGTKVIGMTSNRNSFKWWRAAAAVIILGGIGFFTFRLSMNDNKKSVANLESKQKSNEAVQTPLTDSSRLTRTETTGISDSNKLVGTITTTSKKKPEKSMPAPVDSINLTAGAGSFVATDVPNFKDSVTKNVHSQKSDNADILAKAKQPVANNNKQLQEFSLLEKQKSQNDRQQMNYFRGQVTDANNSPLPFANVTNIRDNVGTYADARGNFTLISADSVLDVQVRSVGFENNFTRLKNNITRNKVVLQDDNATVDKIISYQKPDTSRSRNGTMKLEEPEPADGWTNYDTYLANNINVPDDLKVNQKKGRVEVSFEVNQNGEPVNIKVEKSLCQKCDEEAIRLVKQGPKWKKKNKKSKRVTIAVPFETNE